MIAKIQSRITWSSIIFSVKLSEMCVGVFWHDFRCIRNRVFAYMELRPKYTKHSFKINVSVEMETTQN